MDLNSEKIRRKENRTAQEEGISQIVPSFFNNQICLPKAVCFFFKLNEQNGLALTTMSTC